MDDGLGWAGSGRHGPEREFWEKQAGLVPASGVWDMVIVVNFR